MYDVISVGNNTLDIFAHTDQAKLSGIGKGKNYHKFISYPVGSKLLVTELRHSFGGNGANAAVNIAGLGLKTAYVGNIGKDSTGESILNSLKKNKVHFLGGRSKSSATSIVLDAMGEDRTILTYKGDNNFLDKKQIKFSLIKAKAFYITIMLGKSLEVLQQITKQAHKDNAFIAFNPDQNLIEHELNAVNQIIPLTTLLVMNKDEAFLLTGTGNVDESLKKLNSLGPSIVVITDGKNGATAIQNNIIYTIFPRKGIKIVETTGAGDAFASTLTAGFVMKKPIEYCLKMAMNQSENVIQGHGAQNHLMDRKKLLAITEKDSRKILKRKV